MRVLVSCYPTHTYIYFSIYPVKLKMQLFLSKNRKNDKKM